MRKSGSEWRKWDLHFHTPSSYDYKNKGITNQEIIDILISNNIEVIAITDHHYIDVDRIKELQRLGNGKVTILPGIEFRAELGGSESIHYIGIFSEKSDIYDIWIKIQSKCGITAKDIQDKGGDNNIYCDFKETCDLIHSLGGLVSVHAGSKTNTVENITNSLPYKMAQKKELVLGYIDIYELGQENDQNDYNSIVFPAINQRLPMIICSDNHDIKNYIPKQSLWIKAEPTFEGLKHIIYEPQDRVKIQNHKPDFKEDKLIIDSVKYISNNNLFNSATIHLNKNLNVIIGGKSSGKSILLYNIAKTLEMDDEVSKITNINGDEKYNFREKDKDFDFEVTTLSGATKRLYDGENSIITNIKYIPQNYLSKLAEPTENKKGNELLKYVRGLLLESPEHYEKYNEFLYNIRSNDELRNDIIDNYFKIKSYISEKEKELKELGNEEALKKSIESNSKRIEELKKGLGLSEEQIKEYNLKKEQLEIINSEINKTNEDYKRITGFNTEVINALQELKSRKALIEKSINKEEIKSLFNSKFDFIEQKFDELTSFRDLLKIEEKRFVNDNLFKTIYNNYAERRHGINKDLEEYQKNEQIRVETSKIEKTVSDDKITLQKTQKLKDEIILNKQELQKEKEKLFKLYTDNFNEYPKIVEILKERASLTEEDKLIIEGSAKFNASKFNKRIRSISDLRSFPENNYPLFKEKEDLILFDNNTHLNQIKELFSSIVEKQDFVLNSENRRNPANAVKVLLDDYFVDYWETLYDGDKMDKMSTGKASFVILMLIIGLSNSNAPILIDQPEDNLDNRSITKDLVEYLRKKKLERQIILVTHNANVVVNADAENIIIAHQKGQNDKETSSIYTFDYINGAIEETKHYDKSEKDLLKSMGIREHIADIVEGGEEAFRKREKKYGFKS
ncbi:TrlF family AAA-like ATPase [uncultured Chryseobacterium sp.]|uniref:TrlF family AAA-like ATPase n=1 Tax=uncultured Chryseobacterium sp. TaxID=259322 RepID=UPI0025F7E00F|nr:hypothetical protein [uncultured Chryseobacterium sp.]